jgi:hypothetical protein
MPRASGRKQRIRLVAAASLGKRAALSGKRLEGLGNVVCTRCGSLRTRVLAGGPLQRVLAFVLRQDVIACVRCGFRGRQRKARHISRKRATAQPADTDPRLDLAALDRRLDRRSPDEPAHAGDD